MTLEFVYSVSETAYILRQELGPLRAWVDCLNDMRRNRTSVSGYVLKPIAKLHDGLSWRPEYEHTDIWKFIESVRAINPKAKAGVTPRYKGVSIDPTDRKYGIVRHVETLAVWPKAA